MPSNLEPSRSWFLFLVLLVGCGKSLPEFGEVEGVVLVQGKPQRGLLVRFLPDPDQDNDLPINASGQTDDQGKYRLRYYYKGAEGLGAPVGWHRVLIEDTTLARVPQGAAPPPKIIPKSYANPATTPLKEEVKPGQQTIDFQIPS